MFLGSLVAVLEKCLATEVIVERQQACAEQVVVVEILLQRRDLVPLEDHY